LSQSMPQIFLSLLKDLKDFLNQIHLLTESRLLRRKLQQLQNQESTLLLDVVNFTLKFVSMILKNMLKFLSRSQIQLLPIKKQSSMKKELSLVFQRALTSIIDFILIVKLLDKNLQNLLRLMKLEQRLRQK